MFLSGGSRGIFTKMVQATYRSFVFVLSEKADQCDLSQQLKSLSCTRA